MSKKLGTVAAKRKAARANPLSTPAAKYSESRSNEKAQCWMLTLNCKDPRSPEARISMERFNAACQVSPCTYAVFQPEQGEQGTYHLQAYVELKKKFSLSQIKEHFGSRVHAEIRRGTQAEAIAYCTKEDTRVPDGEIKTYGTPMKANVNGGTRGSRTDWQRAHDSLKSGASILKTLEDQPALTPFISAISKFKHLVDQSTPRTWKPEVIVLYGDPGTGKTRCAFEMCGDDDYFCLPSDSKDLWFDGYDPRQHKTLILDEFTGSKMPATFWNQICDRYQLRLPTKGAHTMCMFERVIITSNFAPSQWWTNKNSVVTSHDAMMRRIDTLVEIRVGPNAYREIELSEAQEVLAPRVLHVTVHQGTFNRQFLAENSPFPICSCENQDCRSNDASLQSDDDPIVISDEEDEPDPPPRLVSKGKRIVPDSEDEDSEHSRSRLSGRKAPFAHSSSESSSSSDEHSDSDSGSLSYDSD